MSFFLMFKVSPSFPPNQRPLTNFNYGNSPRVAPFYKVKLTTHFVKEMKYSLMIV